MNVSLEKQSDLSRAPDRAADLPTRPSRAPDCTSFQQRDRSVVTREIHSVQASNRCLISRTTITDELTPTLDGILQGLNELTQDEVCPLYGCPLAPF